MLDNKQNLEDADNPRTDYSRPVSASRPLASRSLSNGQIASVVVLAFFSIFIVILWTAQFKRNLSGANANNMNNFQDSNKNDLASKDTDGDGLSDYDELNIYKTSPYLEDSDSDGFMDKSEIDSGYDPNCPEGKDCYGTNLLDNNYVEKDSSSADNVSGLLNKINNNLNQPTDNNQGNLNNILSGNTDAATLRQALISAGMDKGALDQFSDKELLETYKDILKK